MSHTAISAVLATENLSGRERLVALSLASFANAEQLAWPGAAVAAARAGLGRSAYLVARDRLVARGLIAGGGQRAGRGQASAVRLLFAEHGPWWDGEVNAPLVEAVLGESRARGPARLLLATMAAFADSAGVLEGVSTEELGQAAGLADSTYRRARTALLASGEVVLVEDGGGRGRTNRWRIPHPGARQPAPASAMTRPEVASDARVVLGTVMEMRAENGAARTVGLTREGAAPDGAALKNPAETPSETPPQTPPETPPQTPSETPPPYVRAGSEALNPRTLDPPSPPAGGSGIAAHVLVEETYRTARGRQRRRRVAVDIEGALAGLLAPDAGDVRDWERFRERLVVLVGERVFDVWFAGLRLAAVDGEGALVAVAVEGTREWIADRFGIVLADAARCVGRVVRVAEPAQARALAMFALRSSPPAAPAVSSAGAAPPAALPAIRLGDAHSGTGTVVAPARLAGLDAEVPGSLLVGGWDRGAAGSGGCASYRSSASSSYRSLSCVLSYASSCGSYSVLSDGSYCALSYTSSYKPSKEAGA